ncbi:MAG: hypothetical protein IT416_00170 [Candidatus Pacebacteria bacterium]|nr:hypothetical protein [Candidatus Paceibacterota bacterium]
MFNDYMFKLLLNLTYKYEFLLGFVGFFSTLWFYLAFPGPINFWKGIPGFINWFSVFLIGDWLSRKLGEGSILPRKKTQTNNFKEIVIASLLMNFISDLTGSWLLKLWYYPLFDRPWVYLFLLAPIGYILFGLILFVFYRFFKHHWDKKVKPGRMSKNQKITYLLAIHVQLLVGFWGIYQSFIYYFNFVLVNNISWYKFDQHISASVNISYFALLWFSLFWIFEYLAFTLKKETLTRDLIRKNFIPLAAILAASLACIILVEFANSPFQVWIFTNWPYQHIGLLKIPVAAYLLWPTQYLLLLSIVRLIDKNNSENVW